MPHFLISTKDIENNTVTVSDKDTVSHLLQSLRIRLGETVKFIDENEYVYETVITSIDKNKLSGEIKTKTKSERKLDFGLCALICILKPDAMHLAVENAVQMGAKEVYTVFSDNSAVKKESVLNKAQKWQKIGNEAFKQCERADLAKVYDLMSFDEIFSKFKKENIIIFAEKYDEMTLSKAASTLQKQEKVLAVFGPEGGFSEKEFEYFKKLDLKLVTLGKLILKAPNAVTAGLFGISQNA